MIRLSAENADLACSGGIPNFMYGSVMYLPASGDMPYFIICSLNFIMAAASYGGRGMCDAWGGPRSA